MKKAKNKSAQALGKKSAEARKKKYAIEDWSAHMKAVRKGKKLTTSVRNSVVPQSTEKN